MGKYKLLAIAGLGLIIGGRGLPCAESADQFNEYETLV